MIRLDFLRIPNEIMAHGLPVHVVIAATIVCQHVKWSSHVSLIHECSK